MNIHQHTDFTLEKLLAMKQSRPVVVFYEGLPAKGAQRLHYDFVRRHVESMATLYNDQAIFARINLAENPSWCSKLDRVPTVGIWRGSVEQVRLTRMSQLESHIKYQIAMARSKTTRAD